MLSDHLPATTDCRAALLEYSNSMRQEDPELANALSAIAQNASPEFVYQIACELRNSMKSFYLAHTSGILLTLVN